MKIERLKENKIKIVINSEELLHWGISADAVVKNLPETREMLFSVLRKAKIETGFSCENSHLVVETAVNTQSGVLTLFVTKVTTQDEKELFEKISAMKKADILKNIHMLTNRDEKRITVKLESLENVIAMCRGMNDYFGGTLYLYEDNYYMTAQGHRAERMLEYADSVKNAYRPVIEEHGVLIADKNAFSLIRSKFRD